ncbi:thymidylate synthase [cyanobacterium endosymbiont of Rhopalodia gibberula]|uniref:thymidylate synthase n=1 Tax=cyanobacterium endosymbiont of Rhopalodia gibberula TaxID=1763363 RepID=UPI000DC6F985|nr:thymidylate synthase [cyanobacterium endosymbiont of Rhopalodia gibberula]BBA79584.1 thymidylate synthase [cyanobacterium endosymbiont of Rhopalodia gibberula]
MRITQSKCKVEYIPHYQPNQLICGYGRTAIITGWTVRQSIAKRLNSEDYAVIGNLYSPTRGISPLIRNLLANPHVRYLVILQATKEDKNAGGCRCLLDFLRQGFRQGISDTGRNIWVINSKITGYVDIEIPADILENLRRSLKYQEAISIEKAMNIIQEFNQLKIEPWGEPLTFPERESYPTVLPGPRYGHRIEGKTIAETWVKILHRIKTIGTIRQTMYGQWQELIDLIAIVTDEPPEFYFPEPNYLPIKRSFLKDYIEQILDDAPQREGVKYTYGQRLRSWFGRDQIEQLINKLVEDIHSSRAVMSLWDVSDYEDSDSPPCLNHIWVRIVDNELSLTATFRSNDMFSAWPANAMGLRFMQQFIQDKVIKKSDHNLTLGPLIIISQSAHIYNDCWEHTQQIIDTEYTKRNQKRNFDDPSGSFLISVKDNRIVVEHLTPGSGEIVNCYSGKLARQLYQKIALNSPSIQIEHAMYLGTELQKAELCLVNKLNCYQQDIPLIF